MRSTVISRWVIPLALLANHAYANCAYGTSLFPRLPNVPVSDFGYDGLKGPLNWYGLNESTNGLCEKGRNQSPIVIDSTVVTYAGSDFEWTVPDYPEGAEFENLGTNVQVVVNGSLVDSVTGTAYNLAQFHFHVPSEHRINGEVFASEMHWVFESEAKQRAVVAFLIELCDMSGCADPVLSSVFSEIAGISTPGDAEMTGPLYFAKLIDKFNGGQVWRYSGSLTTPPCAESVDWLVSTNYLYLDLSTWQAVKTVIKFNARYTQDALGDINLLQNAADEVENATTSNETDWAEW